MKVATEKGYLTITEACERLDRSRWTITRLIRNRKLKSVKRGNARNAEVLIVETSVEDYKRSLAVPPASEVR
jgi:excisionase family DNA binding protein